MHISIISTPTQNIFQLTVAAFKAVPFDRYCAFISGYIGTGQVMEYAL
jgi:hypothetical protein